MSAPSLLQRALAAAALALLPSCEGLPNSQAYGDGYDDRSGYSNYHSSPSYPGADYAYSPPRAYYGGPYIGSGPRYYRDYDHRASSSYRDHHYSTYNRDDRDDRDRDRDRRPSSPPKSSGSDDIRLVKVRDGTRGDLPEGYHSKEWYQQRGISLSKNVYETREGERRGYSGPSSSSSKKKKN